MAEREAVKSFEARCQKIISRHLPQYEKTIGLTAPNQEFRSKLTHAIVACAFQHMLMPIPKRPSGWRKELAQASKEARTAQNSLRRLGDILDGLPQTFIDQLATRWGLFGEIARHSLEREISWLQHVSVITGMYAESVKTLDRGGAPKMLSFELLVKGLADAYQIARVGRKGITWNEHSEKYTGEFVKLVQAVLPLAKQLAELPKRPLRVSRQGKYALGAYLRTHTDGPKKVQRGLNVKNPKRTS